jgi:hypothetical protein
MDEGAVVPILTYEAAIWVEAIQQNKNLTKYKRLKRLINIKKLKHTGLSHMMPFA